MSLVDPAAFAFDPIDAFEAIAPAGSGFSCAPLVYGYVSYAVAGYRQRRLSFADIPAVGERGPAGSALGGTGIAVSARSAYAREAADFAYWVASGPVQAGLYAEARGQPAHADAWNSDAVNAPVGDFYRATRRTLDGAWLQPRHDGYMAFQGKASAPLTEALMARARAKETIACVNALFRENLG